MRRSLWPTIATTAWVPPSSSSDPAKARSVGDRLEAGTVWVDQLTGSLQELPFGRGKQSGDGRELSGLAVSEFAKQRLLRLLPVRGRRPQAG